MGIGELGTRMECWGYIQGGENVLGTILEPFPTGCLRKGHYCSELLSQSQIGSDIYLIFNDVATEKNKTWTLYSAETEIFLSVSLWRKCVNPF